MLKGTKYNGIEINQYQLGEYQGVVQPKVSSGTTTIAGGDYNMVPGSVGSWWWNTLKDGDLNCTSSGSGPPCTDHPTTSSDSGATTVYDGKKIDYLFRANPRSWSADAYQTFTYGYYGSTGVVASDHKLTEGFL